MDSCRISSFIPSYVMFMRVGYDILKFNLSKLLTLYSCYPAASGAEVAMFCGVPACTDIDTWGR